MHHRFSATRKLLALAFVLLASGGFAFGNASFSLNDFSGTANAGTYVPGQTFNVDVFGTITNSGNDPVPNAEGETLHFETSAASATYFTITDRSFTDSLSNNGTSPFNDANQVFSFPQPVVPNGNQYDLGGTGDPNSPVPSPATFFAFTLTLQISPNTPPGTYSIATTTNFSSGKASEINDFMWVNGTASATAHYAPAATYTITVIPEPDSLILIVLGSVVAACFRRFA